MPLYTFKHVVTGETRDIQLRISELDEYKLQNPNLETVISAPKVISGVSADSGRLPEGFTDKLREIKKKHPFSSGVDDLI